MANITTLFILKRREDLTQPTSKCLSTGLYNSASFVHDMLVSQNIKSEISIVVDNNDIDREVTKHRPKYAIIEALWVVPSKFIVLAKLHPTVTWVIRLHSGVPFIAMEGMAMDWICQYLQLPNVVVSCNSPRMHEEVIAIAQVLGLTDSEIKSKAVCLPNFYPQSYAAPKSIANSDVINVSCFGAVRPLKNHLQQAISALKFANSIGRKLHFHINTRIEKGDAIINNLQKLFNHLTPQGHRLICHEWMPHDTFIEICKGIDIGLQVSFSETFNIVGADLISAGIPLVSSPELPWAPAEYTANPTDSNDIADKLLLTYNNAETNVLEHQKKLTKYTNDTLRIWRGYFTK